MSEDNGESEQKSNPTEVVLDQSSKRQLVAEIVQAVKDGSSKTAEPQGNLSDEEVAALTDVIDEHVDKRVEERMSGQKSTGETNQPETEEQRKARVKETVDEVVKFGRQGLSEVLRLKYEAERAKAKKE